MIQLFLGAQEIVLLLYSFVLPLGFAVLVLYVLYRMVDGWVEKSTSVRREQNELLAKLIENLEKKPDN